MSTGGGRNLFSSITTSVLTTPQPVKGTLTGLTHEGAARRLVLHGPNKIQRETETPVWIALSRQFSSPVVLLLVAACAVSGALGEVLDAVAIGGIVVLNGLVGFFQEHRAERTILALRSLSAPRARVFREGRSVLLPSTEIVPGDLLLLKAGDIVAADGRLLEAHLLSTNEAALTGESAPVEKSIEPVASNAPLAERRDSIF